MHGWRGKVLYIDLTGRSCRIENPDEAFYRRHIGGESVASALLLSGEGMDDALVIATGPLAGSKVPASGFCSVMARSPLGGGLLRGKIGGGFGPCLKASGFDALIITGSAESWTGIELYPTKEDFADAASFAELKSGEAFEKLSGADSVLLGGLSGRKGVRFSDILADGFYACGAAGAGYIFAQKKLCYITVSGTKESNDEPAFADRDALDAATVQINRLLAASTALSGELGLKSYGTAAFFDLTNARRMAPTANFRKTFFDDSLKLNAPVLAKDYGCEPVACADCPIGCIKRTGEGKPFPGFNEVSHFSALLENSDSETLLKACEICFEYGADATEAAAVLAAYAEIEGRTLDTREIVEKLIAIFSGEDSSLAGGVSYFAEASGHREASMTVKGRALPACDPRGAYGMALSFAVAAGGEDVFRSGAIIHEMLRKPVATDRFSFSGKALINKNGEDAASAAGSLAVCPYMFMAASLEEYAKAVAAATGIDFTPADLVAAGERAAYAERILLFAWGFDASSDDLPERFFSEAGSGAYGIEVAPIKRKGFLAARAAYYRLRGLDEKGRPCKNKAAELELPWKN